MKNILHARLKQMQYFRKYNKFNCTICHSKISLLVIIYFQASIFILNFRHSNTLLVFSILWWDFFFFYDTSKYYTFLILYKKYLIIKSFCNHCVRIVISICLISIWKTFLISHTNVLTMLIKALIWIMNYFTGSFLILLNKEHNLLLQVFVENKWKKWFSMHEID